ncbi:unnamed protein product [Echinostoma caproni]|uniref:Rab-GAP TBC domain-containing protein n=1 Tax=Echinostoma caproni TaxID=27848 RepID=A0A3P8KFF4_9TREM|nr:unnamed protein product [Echinostoma caproni]
MLGVYPWNATEDEVDRMSQENERLYQIALAEWRNAQYWIKDPDKPEAVAQPFGPRNIVVRNGQGSCDSARTNNPLSSPQDTMKLDESLSVTSRDACQSTSPDPQSPTMNGIVHELSGSPNPVSPVHEANTSNSLTPTATSDDLVTPAADRQKKFNFDQLVNGTTTTSEHITPRLEFSPDSGTSIDMESEGAADFELPDEPPYSDDILDALGINLYRIDKDVSRCDRNHSFFANPKKDLTSDDLNKIQLESDFSELNDNLNKLRNVICTWVWLHLDAGYIQGMCDLLAPLLVVLEDESLTYACFCRLMEWMLPNFPVSKATSPPASSRTRLPVSCSSTNSAVTETPAAAPVRPTLLSLVQKHTNGSSSPVSPAPSNDSVNLIDEGCSDVDRSSSVKILLPQSVRVPTVPSPYASALASSDVNCMDLRFSNLKALIEVFDPELFQFLTEKSMDSQFYFCYRWLLLDFKREFKYEDVFAIWEVIWTSRRLVAYDFGVFFALALLQYYRDIILYYDMDLTEIIRFYNELTEQHSTKALLDLARSLVFQMQNILHDS